MGNICLTFDTHRHRSSLYFRLLFSPLSSHLSFFLYLSIYLLLPFLLSLSLKLSPLFDFFLHFISILFSCTHYQVCIFHKHYGAFLGSVYSWPNLVYLLRWSFIDRVYITTTSWTVCCECLIESAFHAYVCDTIIRLSLRMLYCLLLYALLYCPK